MTPTSGVAHLVSSWLATARQAGARGDVADVGARLLASYAEPHRRYHNLRHLDEVLRHVDDLAGHARDPVSVRLAAWFHDAVYDVRAADSEERSARRATEELTGLHVPPATVAEAARLVRLTAGHRCAEDDADGAVLCDADLAVLAADPARYARYAADVRAEYAHVPDAQFARARTAVLRGLLELPRLYRTPTGRSWEHRARANVSAEVERLAAGGGA